MVENNILNPTIARQWLADSEVIEHHSRRWLSSQKLLYHQASQLSPVEANILSASRARFSRITC